MKVWLRPLRSLEVVTGGQSAYGNFGLQGLSQLLSSTSGWIKMSQPYSSKGIRARKVSTRSYLQDMQDTTKNPRKVRRASQPQKFVEK